MGQDTLVTGLSQASLEKLDTLQLGATIRQDMLDSGLDAPPEARRLPRLSIDLGRPTEVNDDLEIRAVLGEGGMGQVFLAWHHSLEREVAVKTALSSRPTLRTPAGRVGPAPRRIACPGIFRSSSRFATRCTTLTLAEWCTATSSCPMS